MAITNPKTGKVFYTVPEYCEMLGYNPVYIRDACKKGKVEGATKRRGTWLIPENTVTDKIKADPIYGDDTELLEASTDQPLNLDVTEDDLSELLDDL